MKSTTRKSMSGRIIAISDIHGCLAALQAVLAAVDPRPEDTIVTLGDYADRGPDARGVLELLIALGKQTRLVPLLGNHDEMLLEHLPRTARTCCPTGCCSGATPRLPVTDRTIRPMSGRPTSSSSPVARWRSRPSGTSSSMPIIEPTWRWTSCRAKCCSGNRSSGTCRARTSRARRRSWATRRSGAARSSTWAISKCIDTWCYGDGWLTAFDVESGRVWQADKQGAMRK